MSLLRISKPCFSIILVALLCIFAGETRAVDCEKAKQYYSLGTKLSNYTERRAAFEKAVQLCPSYAEAHVNLADAFEHLAVLQKKESVNREAFFDKAIEHYQKATELNSQFFIAYVGLGEVYAALARYPYAKQAYEKALQLKPGYERAQNGLATVQSFMAKDESLGKTFSTRGVMTADQIVQEVKSPEFMGPKPETVPRVRLMFPNIIFEGWSSKISHKESLSQLNEIGRALSSKELQGYEFSIEGHANTVGLDKRDGAAKLMKLSDERAEAVKQYLVRKFSIASNRISARGFGCARPQFPDDNPEHREKNRRVEIVFQRQDSD